MSKSIVTHLCIICKKPTHARGYCKPHYAKLCYSGEIIVDKRVRTRTVEERFWEKVVKSDGCWLWTGATAGNGYGRLGVGGALVRATQISWEIHNGPVPKDLFLLHHCDTPRCVRPDHLFLGTQRDNIHDMVKKGRTHIGEAHCNSKLTEEKVYEIYSLLDSGVRPIEICRIYDISRMAIWSIDKRRTWKHLKRPSRTITDQMALL